MEELLKIVNEHYKLSDQTSEIFIRSMKNHLASGEINEYFPVYCSKLLHDLENVVTVENSDDDTLPDFLFKVDVGDEAAFVPDTGYLTILVSDLVQTIKLKKFKKLRINKVKIFVDVPRRRLNCIIQMEGD